MFEGFLSVEECQASSQYQLDPVVHDQRQLDWLTQQPFSAPTTVWLKLNTGMNRLGLPPADIPAVWKTLQACP